MHVVNIPTEEQTVRDYSFEVATDSRHLFAYANLLQRQYKEELNLDIAPTVKQKITKNECTEYCFVIRDGEKVIGGAKLYLAYSAKDRLPLDNNDFQAQTLLPNGYGDFAYGEIGRLVLHPDYRGGELTKRLIAFITQFAVKNGCAYLFVIAPAVNAILYRRVCKGLNMPTMLRSDVKLTVDPVYSGLDVRLLSCDLRYLPETPRLSPAFAEAV